MFHTLAFINMPQAPEMIIIFMAALIIFGPKSLPKLGRALGEGIREFRAASNRITEAITELDVEEKKAVNPRLPPAPDPGKEESVSDSKT